MYPHCVILQSGAAPTAATAMPPRVGPTPNASTQIPLSLVLTSLEPGTARPTLVRHRTSPSRIRSAHLTLTTCHSCLVIAISQALPHVEGAHPSPVPHICDHWLRLPALTTPTTIRPRIYVARQIQTRLVPAWHTHFCPTSALLKSHLPRHR